MWADDPQSWAVLDATHWSRALWHQTLHRHPIIAGYTTRTPERLSASIRADPTLNSFFGPPLGDRTPLEPRFVPLARSRLRTLRVRFVIVDEAHRAAASATGLTPISADGDVAIFGVPP